MARPILILAAVIAAASLGPAEDELPRRARLGVAMAPPPGGEPGVMLQDVAPDGPAAAAGLRDGDVLLRAGGADVASPMDVQGALKGLGPGKALTIEYRRGEEAGTAQVPYEPAPMEQHEGLETILGAVRTESGLHRTIILKPEGEGPFPAIFFIPGYNCMSVEFTPGGGYPTEPMLVAIAREGYAIGRMEKSNMGDSIGEPCEGMGLVRESEDFLAGLRDFKAQPFVDADQVFLFGHSMGGVTGPWIAAQEPVAGIAVYGSLGRTFAEYWGENIRRQTALAGADPVQLEETMRVTQRWIAGFFIDGLAPEEVFARYPDLAPLGPSMGIDGDQMMGRHWRFWQEVHEVSMATALRDADTRVLALWGEADFVSSRVDHEWVAATVNAYNPGWGEFAVVPESDHAMRRHASEAAAFQDRRGGAEFNPAITGMMLDWLGRVRAARGATAQGS